MTPELLALLRFEKKLEKALALGGYAHNLSDVMEKVAAGRAQVFHNEDAIVVTEVVPTRRGPVLNIWLTAGNMKGAVELTAKAEKAATDYGCVSATFMGRMGWLRAAEPRENGWTPSAVVFVKDLGG